MLRLSVKRMRRKDMYQEAGALEGVRGVVSPWRPRIPGRLVVLRGETGHPVSMSRVAPLNF
eukprot:5189218-Pyramimonas_sp.AAC.1